MGDREYKRLHKEQGLCVNCSRKAFTNRTLCLIHREAHRETVKRYRVQNKDKIAKHNKDYRKKMAKNNRCTCCSAPLDPDIDESYTHCLNCRQRLHSPRGGYATY